MLLLSDYVSFPHLGWRLPISDTLLEFRLFGIDISIRWYGVLIALGFLLAVFYAMRRYQQFGLDGDRMLDVVLVVTLLSFIGARLYYVLFSGNLQSYLQNPLSILEVWKGGLAIYGGIIVAFLSGIGMCKWRKVNTLALFDLASLGFLIGQSVGRWGNFFNQEAFGGNTDLPWGMSGSIISQGFNGSGYETDLPVHPTFLYESLWCLLGFVLLHVVSKRAYRFKGQIFSLYIIWYGAGRFMIEGLRTDSLYLGTMRVSQLVAALAVLGGIALYAVLRARAAETRRDLFATEADTLSLTEADVPADEEPSGEEPAVCESTKPETPEQQEETDGDQNLRKSDCGGGSCRCGRANGGI